MDSAAASPESMDQDSDAPTTLKPGEGPPKNPRAKAQGRKRTKSGCLTCRKRRIKCDETKPVCQNCIKSKRQCEGYNKRVVFKDPMNSYRPSLSTAMNQPSQRHVEPPRELTIIPNPPYLGQNAKKPPRSQMQKTVEHTPLPKLSSGSSFAAAQNVFAFQDTITKDNFSEMSKGSHPVDMKSDTIDRSRIPEPIYSQAPLEWGASNIDNSTIKEDPYANNTRASVHNSPQDWAKGSSSASSFAAQELFHNSNTQFPVSPSASNSYHAYSTTESWAPLQEIDAISVDNRVLPRTQTPLLIQENAIPPEHSYHQRLFDDDHSQRDDVIYKNFEPSQVNRAGPDHGPRTQSSLTGITVDDDDPWDISDDDTSMDEVNEPSINDSFQEKPFTTNNLGIQVVAAASVGQFSQEVRPRFVRDFIDGPDMLTTYIPSPQATPLSDPVTARIFCHFVHVTGPCMSMFERHPANPSLIFQGHPIPASQQHIWTYTFPSLALNNPALLYAMLAIASLHIAKLQNGPVTASLKHYAFALRRIARLLQAPQRRKQPATLAAALLLSYYEVWTADHQKWSNHVLGARQLLREIDFAGISRHIRQADIQRRNQERFRYSQQQQEIGHNFYDESLQRQAYVNEVDENLVDLLVGSKVLYDSHDPTTNVTSTRYDNKTYSQKELDDYEIQRDLFWWYCKQDAYQSLLGGGRLFLDYSVWTQCPPRAPIGRLNATYGTYDHLILLLGRVAQFAAKDGKRKRQAIKENGGWRPPGGMFDPRFEGVPRDGAANMTRPPLPTLTQIPQGPPPQMPSFAGMVPGVTEAQLPMGFTQTSGSSASSPSSSSSDGNDAHLLQNAIEEWEEIRSAFELLNEHFGEDFQPLGPDFMPPIETPFGPALQYRTYGIAGIWMNYHMGLITCHRAHPSMPPAAMAAAGIAARQTAEYANNIGRIMAAIVPDIAVAEHVNPGVAAALLESTTPLFFAGVQYQAPAQRDYTTMYFHAIARLTGWQTALAEASGCETSWIKQAELGRGPPYIRLNDQVPQPPHPEFISRNVIVPDTRLAAIDTRLDSSSVHPSPGVKFDAWSGRRRLDRALVGRNETERKELLADGGRAHYAIGVLGVESDFEQLGLDEEDEDEDEDEDGGQGEN